MEKIPGLLNMKETAQRLGCSVQTVYYQIMMGNLVPEKHFNRNWFTVEQIDEFIQNKKHGNGKNDTEGTGEGNARCKTINV